MPFDYDYVEPEDLSPYRLIKPGDGMFKILQAETKISKSSNNPMLVLTMDLKDSDGKKTLYNEYIVKGHDQDSREATANKIYNITKSIGKPHLYGHPLREYDLMGATGRCIIKTQKSKNPDYPKDKSVIAQYLDPEASGDSNVYPGIEQMQKQREQAAKQPVQEIDDDIPF